MRTLLEVDNVSVSFDGFKAVDNLSFTIGYNELQAIIGPNGAGKTTFMDIITGQTKPDSGNILWGEKSINFIKKNETEIALLGIGRKFQNPTVFENKYFYGKEYRVLKSLKNKFEMKIDGKKYLYTKPSLNGKHQEENASISIYFAKIMKNMGYRLNTKDINAAIKKTAWPGRLEIINYKHKKIILDGSHNIDGADKLNEFLKTERIKPIVLFLSLIHI